MAVFYDRADNTHATNSHPHLGLKEVTDLAVQLLPTATREVPKQTHIVHPQGSRAPAGTRTRTELDLSKTGKGSYTQLWAEDCEY